MKTISWSVFISLVLFAAGCDNKGVPVAFAKTCDKANDDTTVEITGYFKASGMSMCSKHGNEPMRCPIDFAEKPDSKDGMVRVHIDLGSAASSVEDVKGKGLIIHDNEGAVVENGEKAKVTADVTVLDTSTGDKTYQNCFVTAKKIEKSK